MENASKALIMAGGVLIGVLIISLAVYLFVSFGQTSAEINSENAQKQLTQFNAQFTSYEDKEGLTIYDVMTVAGYANENNNYYDNSQVYEIQVTVRGLGRIDNNIEKLQKEIENQSSSGNLSTYSCKVTEYNENGRVKTVVFTKK